MQGILFRIDPYKCKYNKVLLPRSIRLHMKFYSFQASGNNKCFSWKMLLAGMNVITNMSFNKEAFAWLPPIYGSTDEISSDMLIKKKWSWNFTKSKNGELNLKNWNSVTFEVIQML